MVVVATVVAGVMFVAAVVLMIAVAQLSAGTVVHVSVVGFISGAASWLHEANISPSESSIAIFFICVGLILVQRYN